MTEQDDQVMRLQEAYANAYNEITQPDKVFVATQYFRKKWVPLLGPALSWLIIALRQHCYWNRQTGEKRDWCLVTQEELAQEIGVSSKTVRRLLQHEHAGRFVVEVKNRYGYDNQLGKLVRKHSFYRVRMDDPLIPEDEELLRQRMADELAGLSVDPETGQRDMLKLLDRMISGDLDDEGDLPDKISARRCPEPVEGSSPEPPVPPRHRGGQEGWSKGPEDSGDPVESEPDPHTDLPDKMSGRSGDEGDLADKLSARSGHLEDKMSGRSGDLPDKMSGILYTGQNVRINNSTYTVLDFPDEVHQQQQYTPATQPPLADVVVVSPDDLKDLYLQDDQVIMDRDGTGSHFVVMSIAQVLQHELRRQRSEPFYKADICYAVGHALGEDPDDWTDEELSRIRRKQTLERELRERYQRIGAFTLEEALQHYFSPEFTARILKDRPPSELKRIEDWIAYVRQQKNLTNPAGFLRTSIESGETAPGSNHELRISNLEFGSPQSAIRNSKSAIRNPQSAIPDLEVPGTDMTSRQLWQAALNELQLQMTHATFDTWLRNTWIARVGNNHLVIATPNPHAVEWLEVRLDPVICRTLAGILERPVTVKYEAATARGRQL